MTRAERLAWLIGLIGVALAALGWAVAPARFHLAWLAALSTWLGWPLGSIALLLIHRLTGGDWGLTLAPALRAAAASLLLVLLAVVPLLLGLGIYPWLRTPPPHNHLYLNAPFFMLRLALFVVLWLVLALLTLRRGTAAVAAVGLPLLALSFTFASIDLTLSLEPQFSSSIYGLLQGTAAVLFALALAVVPAAHTAPPERLAALAKLLLALTVLWAYLDFMQFLIVWEADLPNEAPYYLRRLAGGWGVIAATIAALHFLLPFALLLSPHLQRSRAALTSVAALLAVTEVVRGWWLVLPEASHGVGWIELACAVSFAGLSSATALRAARGNWVQAHV